MTEKTHDQQQLERLTFFSDAVFAIAMTLLVVEIRLPPIAAPVAERVLAQALLDLIPQYIGFLVSFLVIGRFWIGHHRVFGRLRRADDRLVALNLLFLLTIAFSPFPTVIVSHYVGSRVGVGVYAGWLIVAGLANLAVERHALHGAIAAPGGVDDLRRWTRAAWSPIVIGVLAFVVGMVSPLYALIPFLGSPLITRLFTRRAPAAKPPLPLR